MATIIDRKWRWALAPGLIIIGLAVWLIFFHQKAAAPTTQNASYNTVYDATNGLTFNMSKNFVAISRPDLSKLNPDFSYGYRVANDPNAQCIVSLSDLKKGAIPSNQEARDKLLAEVKTVHPDAVLANEATSLKTAKFGNAAGLLLEIDYGNGASKIRRVEVLGVGKTNQVIAYCESLAADNAKYNPDFTTFFSSLKLTK